MAFRGHYEHSLDAKNRLSIPARVPRGLLRRPRSVAKDTDACITVSPPDAHESRVEARAGGQEPARPRSTSRSSASSRATPSTSSSTRPGRVILPAPLLAHAGIEKEVVVVGVDDHLELWSAQGWAEQQALLDSVIGEVTDSLGDPS